MSPVVPTVPVDFPAPAGPSRGICIPKGCRVLRIQDQIVTVPGPDGATRLYAHPDDVALLRRANP